MRSPEEIRGFVASGSTYVDFLAPNPQNIVTVVDAVFPPPLDFKLPYAVEVRP